MADRPPMWITDLEVAALLDLPTAIGAVERALAAEGRGVAACLEKTHRLYGGRSTLHALGGTWEDAHLVGTKTWAHTPGGASPVAQVWDADTGDLLAVMQAFALGQLRTAAVSAVGTRWLAPSEADTLAILGSGRQALPQVAAVAAVRPLRKVTVWGRDAARRAGVVDAVRRAGYADVVVEEPDVDAAVAGAAIVTTATRATEPILDAPMVSAVTHINAIGAITPERAELTASLVEGCSLVAVDHVPAARRLARELEGRFAKDPSSVTGLAAVVAGNSPGPTGTGPTLLKAVGSGLADLAVAAAAIEAVRRAGGGVELPDSTYASRTSPPTGVAQ